MSTSTANPDLLVVVETEEGFRVYSPLTPAEQYVVRDTGDDITCTCEGFARNGDDPEWRCNHIKAVLARSPEAKPSATPPSSNGGAKVPPGSAKKTSRTGANGTTMVIKRSVSPDGRIDSLSVEFSSSIGKCLPQDIRNQAEETLKLQADIIHKFLLASGKPAPPTPARNGGSTAAPARLLGVAAMNSQWGRRRFLNVQVNGQISKLFGSAKQLAEAIAAAGFPNVGEHISEGMQFKLPCRAITKQSPDGRYVNIDRLLPASNGD